MFHNAGSILLWFEMNWRLRNPVNPAELLLVWLLQILWFYTLPIFIFLCLFVVVVECFEASHCLKFNNVLASFHGGY